MLVDRAHAPSETPVRWDPEFFNYLIRIGLASKGGTFSPQGTQERFGMIGMDIRLGNNTSCRRMFLPWTLIFGSLWTFFMCLCTFILHPDMHTSFERLLRSSWF